MSELPLYKSHKTVRAAEVECFNDDMTQLYLSGVSTPVRIDPKMLARYQPVAGDFYVVYEDGYQSFSPRKAFLEGYTRVET